MVGSSPEADHRFGLDGAFTAGDDYYSGNRMSQSTVTDEDHMSALLHRAATATALAGLLAACDSNLLTDRGQDPTDSAIAFSHSGGGGASIDQSQPTADGSAAFTFAIGGPSAQILAQVFTAGVTGRLRELEMPVGCAAGTLVVEIRDAVAGLPSATVLRSESFAATSLPQVVASFVPLRFRPSPDLNAGSEYAFVLRNQTGSCGILPGPVGDPYAGGNSYFFDPATSQWISLSLGNGREDLPFFTYMH